MGKEEGGTGEGDLSPATWVAAVHDDFMPPRASKMRTKPFATSLHLSRLPPCNFYSESPFHGLILLLFGPFCCAIPSTGKLHGNKLVFYKHVSPIMSRVLLARFWRFVFGSITGCAHRKRRGVAQFSWSGRIRHKFIDRTTNHRAASSNLPKPNASKPTTQTPRYRLHYFRSHAAKPKGV